MMAISSDSKDKFDAIRAGLAKASPRPDLINMGVTLAGVISDGLVEGSADLVDFSLETENVPDSTEQDGWKPGDKLLTLVVLLRRR